MSLILLMIDFDLLSYFCATLCVTSDRHQPATHSKRTAGESISHLSQLNCLPSTKITKLVDTLHTA